MVTRNHSFIFDFIANYCANEMLEIQSGTRLCLKEVSRILEYQQQDEADDGIQTFAVSEKEGLNKLLTWRGI